MSRQHLIATGCDAAHFELAEDLIASIRAVCGTSYSIGFVRFCNSPLPQTIASQVDLVVSCSDAYSQFNGVAGFYCAFESIKPRIPELFPGFDIYTWIDADCWIQNDRTLRKMEGASEDHDICIHPETDIHYFQHPTPQDWTIQDWTISVYQRAMPKDIDINILRKPMFNSGVVSARRDSKIWRKWGAALLELRKRYTRGEASFFSDQIPLHYLIHTESVSLFPLRAIDNWLTHLSIPRFKFDSKKLCVPTLPHDEINIVHLAARAKDVYYNLAGQRTRLRYRDLTKAMQRISR